MQGLKTLLLVAALIYGVESRVRLGKIFKRQARNREFRAILGSPSAAIPQAVVVGSFAGDQKLPVAQRFAAATPQRISVGPGIHSQTRPLNPVSQFNAQQLQAQFQQQHPQQLQQLQQQQHPIQFPQQPPQQTQFQQQQFQQQQFQQQQQQQQFQQPQGLAAFGGQQAQRQVPPVRHHTNSQQVAIQNPAVNYQQANKFNAKPLINQVYQQAPQYSQLIGVKDATSKRIVDRLISNATLIRPNIIDGFSCKGRQYGYYADTINECQIFHVCFPLRDVFPEAQVPDITYEFSFICNEFTKFSQDSLTCAWEYEAVPCEYAEELYVVNDEFFKTTVKPPPAYTVGPAVGIPVGSAYPSPGLPTDPLIPGKK